MINIRKTLILSGLCLTALLSGLAGAQTYPSKTITIVVPTAPGGANDAMARIVAQGLSQKLGQPVIVDNKPGANGAIATEFVARAIPDGHTILWGYIATHAINPALQRLKYDPITDFEPIGMVANSPTLLVTTNSLPVTNAKELVALLKAKPDSISYASAGMGTAPHLTAELFQINTGTQMLHVPYKGSAPAMTDLMGGQVNIAFSSIEPAIQLIKTNRIKPIAVTTLQKVNGLPNVPTIAESGLKDFDAAGWNGIVAPAGTPPDIIAILNQAVNSALRQPSIKAKMDSQGVVLDIQTPAQFGQTIRTETEKWATVIKKAQIKLD